MESLTDKLVEEALAIIKEVESLGGMAKAINAGFPKSRIEESAAKRQVCFYKTNVLTISFNN